MGQRFEAEVEACLGPASEPVYRSLEVEAKQRGPHKGFIEVSLRGGCIVVKVASRDLTGLRALLNSYLLLMHASAAALEAAGGVDGQG